MELVIKEDVALMLPESERIMVTARKRGCCDTLRPSVEPRMDHCIMEVSCQTHNSVQSRESVRTDWAAPRCGL